MLAPQALAWEREKQTERWLEKSPIIKREGSFLWLLSIFR